MSFETLQFALDHMISCKNPDCGHTNNEHPLLNNSVHRDCTVCGCTSYEFLTRLNPLVSVGLESLTDNIQISNVNLEKQVDKLEDELEKTLKEKRSLTKQLKSKTTQIKKLKTKNKELEHRVGSLKIDLGIAEHVKQNLKHIVDSNEEE